MLVTPRRRGGWCAIRRLAPALDRLVRGVEHRIHGQQDAAHLVLRIAGDQAHRIPRLGPVCRPELLDDGEHFGDGRHGSQPTERAQLVGLLDSCARMAGMPMTIGTRMPSTSAMSTPRSVPARSESVADAEQPEAEPLPGQPADRGGGERPPDDGDHDQRDEVAPPDVGVDPAAVQQRHGLEPAVPDHELRREDARPRGDRARRAWSPHPGTVRGWSHRTRAAARR